MRDMYKISVDHESQETQANGAEAEETEVAELLIELSRMIQASYANISERHGLTPAQAKLLCVLADGSRGMAELADCFGVGRAALTGLVDRTERHGYVERLPVPDDRRALRVALTDAGRDRAAAFHRETTAGLNRFISSLLPDDRNRFRDVLARIVTSSVSERDCPR